MSPTVVEFKVGERVVYAPIDDVLIEYEMRRGETVEILKYGFSSCQIRFTPPVKSGRGFTVTSTVNLQRIEECDSL